MRSDPDTATVLAARIGLDKANTADTTIRVTASTQADAKPLGCAGSSAVSGYDGHRRRHASPTVRSASHEQLPYALRRVAEAGLYDRIAVGSIALRTSSVAHGRMPATRNSHSFMGKYIFPGGLLPSPSALGRRRHMAACASPVGPVWIPLHGDLLWLWPERFTAHRPQIQALGLGLAKTFCRLRNLYAACSEAGFRSPWRGLSSQGGDKHTPWRAR